MKIAITGAGGFIGRHILKDPAMNLHDLTLLDLRVPAEHPNNAKYIPFDLSSADAGTYQRIGAPDTVIHLAWGELNNFQSPAHMTCELPMHFNFLNHMVVGGLKRLVVMGTCYEYGLQEGALEETMKCHPATWYGLAKYSLLRELELLQKTRPFELLWPRLFYIYGEGQSPNSIYPQLMRAIDAGDPEFRMSTGEQIRDYIHIAELAQTLSRLALSPHTGIVNACSGKPISLRRQVETWIAEKKSNIQLGLGHYSYRDYEPLAFWGNNEKMKQFLSR